jgi:hypothetical protein
MCFSNKRARYSTKIPILILQKFCYLVESEEPTRPENALMGFFSHAQHCSFISHNFLYYLCFTYLPFYTIVFSVIYSIGQNISSYLPDQLSGALATLATYVAKAANPVSLY